MTYMTPDIKDRRVFLKDKDGLSFRVKKTEKLSSVLYIISDMLSKDEPLRTEFRKKAVALISDIFSEDKSFFLSDIDATLALLRVARAGLLISEMNADLITREFGVLRDALDESQKVSLPADFFSASTDVPIGSRRIARKN